MSSISSRGRRHRQLTNEVKDSMRDLRVQLALLNHRVGARLELKDVDLDCLDLISRYGPLSPSALARRAGLHPATMTGIIDRLERGRWIARERDPADRRAVLLRIRPERAAEVLRLYIGMNHSLDQICADYSEADLSVLADFMRRATEAGHGATEDLS
jgi:DNA-binding MarR family transcriptional regulator